MMEILAIEFNKGSKIMNYDELISKSKFFSQRNKIIVPSEDKRVEVRLNIGSGPNVFPHSGWINYDREDISEYLQYISTTDRISEMPAHQKILAAYLRKNGVQAIDFRVQDLKNGFSQHLDDSVDAIYLGQMIEHINPIYEAPQFIKECYRMLKSKGVVRITTPDLDLLIHAYLNNQMDKFIGEQPDFYKNADPSAQLAYIMYGASGPKCTWNNYDGHMCLYTQKSMTALLTSAGFTNVTYYYETGASKDPVMAKEAVDAGLSHSFIVEAVK